MGTTRTTTNQINSLLAELETKAKGSAAAKQLAQDITLASIDKTSTEVFYQFVRLFKERATQFAPDKLTAERASSLSTTEEKKRIKEFYQTYQLDAYFDLQEMSEQTQLTETFLFAVLSDLTTPYLLEDGAILQFVRTAIGSDAVAVCARKDSQYGAAALQFICMKFIKEIYTENKNIQLFEKNTGGEYAVNAVFIEALNKKLAKELSDRFETDGLITPETPQMLNATNTVIDNLRKENWLSIDIDKVDESESHLFKDLPRSLIINQHHFNKSPEHEAHCNFKNESPHATREETTQHYIAQVQAFFKRVLFNNDQQAFDKYYPALLKFYNQAILYPFKKALQQGNGNDSFVPVDMSYNAHIKFRANEITLDCCSFNFSFIDPNSMLNTALPFVINFSNRLTDEGFKFSHGYIKDSSLKEACLGQALLCQFDHSSDKGKNTTAQLISEAVAKNSAYYVEALPSLTKSPFTDFIIDVIRQAERLYPEKKLSSESYITIVNTLLNVTEFSLDCESKLFFLPSFIALFELPEVKTDRNLRSNLRKIAEDLHAITDDCIKKNPENTGYEDNIAQLKKLANDEAPIIEEKKNLFQRILSGIKNAIEKHPLVTALIVTTLLTAAVIGITIATMGVATIAGLVGGTLMYAGATTFLATASTAAMAAATAIGAAVVTAASYAGFGIGVLIAIGVTSLFPPKPEPAHSGTPTLRRVSSTRSLVKPEALNAEGSLVINRGKRRKRLSDSDSVSTRSTSTDSGCAKEEVNRLMNTGAHLLVDSDSDADDALESPRP